MSIKIKEKIVKTIDDTRSLTPIECMGIIFDSVVCDDDDINTKWFFSQSIMNSNGWSFSCNPEQKSCILTINNELTNKSEEMKCELLPNNEKGIIVEISVTNPNLNKKFLVSIDRLEDLTI